MRRRAKCLGNVRIEKTTDQTKASSKAVKLLGRLAARKTYGVWSISMKLHLQFQGPAHTMNLKGRIKTRSTPAKCWTLCHALRTIAGSTSWRNQTQPGMCAHTSSNFLAKNLWSTAAKDSAKMSVRGTRWCASSILTERLLGHLGRVPIRTIWEGRRILSNNARFWTWKSAYQIQYVSTTTQPWLFLRRAPGPTFARIKSTSSKMHLSSKLARRWRRRENASNTGIASGTRKSRAAST